MSDEVNKLRLVPFDPMLAQQIMTFYYEPEYAHWARGAKRYLTLEECQHLPEIFRSEFLHIVSENTVVGLARFYEENSEVVNSSIVLSKDFHRKGLCSPSVDLIESYAKNVRGYRIMTSENLKKDEWLSSMAEEKGYTKIGEIIDYINVNGKYETTVFYYKILR